MVNARSFLAACALCLPSASLALRNKNAPRPVAMHSDSKLLALRGGGVTNDQLINLMGGLAIVQGMAGWIAPKKTMAPYGIKEMTNEEMGFLRFLMGINVVSGVTMFADESTAVPTCLTAWALSTTANVPLMETFEIPPPKAPIFGSIAVFGVLGELARQGKIGDDIAFNILTVLLVPLSMAEIAAPQAPLDAFGVAKPSTLGKSLFENFSFTKMSTGLFVLVSKLTGKKGLGLAASCAGNSLNCIKTITRADAVGISKPGLIVWTALQTAVAVMAYKNEM
jgi:hypothetical protein